MLKGGGKCSICGSPGVTKASCPLNPSAKNPKPDKHPMATSSKKDSSNKNDPPIIEPPQPVAPKQDNSETLYGIINDIKVSCPDQELNLDLLKKNIKDKKLVAKSLKKPTKDSSLNVEPDLNVALLQQDVKKQKDKKSKNKKPAPKKPKKGKSVINLKDYLVPGYIMEEKQFSVTVKKQLLSDEANAIVVLVTDNRDGGKEYVLKAELQGGGEPQIHNEVNMMSMIARGTHYNSTIIHIKDKDITEGGIPFLKVWGMGGSPQIHHTISNGGPKVRCLVEEKLDESLAQYAKKGLTIPQIKEMAREYLKILQYIHSRGFVHSDIKPPNLMLKHEGGDIKYYIIDFGITTRYTIKGLQHRGQGTPVYQSIYCEEFTVNKAKRFISRLEDVEALGYILLELSTGSLPWSVKDSPIGSRLKSKLGAEEYAEKIKDSNLRTAVIQMVSAHKGHFSTEPEYKKLIKLLQ